MIEACFSSIAPIAGDYNAHVRQMSLPSPPKYHSVGGPTCAEVACADVACAEVACAEVACAEVAWAEVAWA